jgi:hypothetical protein
MVDEVNRISKSRYTYKDRKCPKKSRQMCRLYLDWCEAYNLKKGYTLTETQLARCWNGGNWNSWKNKNTEKYEMKIKENY